MRMANAYFLVVCILQSIPAISLTNGVPTSFLPLSVVLLFDGVVTAREDYKRHVDDYKANNSKSERGGWRLRGWWRVVVAVEVGVNEKVAVKKRATVVRACPLPRSPSHRLTHDTPTLTPAQRSRCATAGSCRPRGRTSAWATR